MVRNKRAEEEARVEPKNKIAKSGALRLRFTSVDDDDDDEHSWRPTMATCCCCCSTSTSSVHKSPRLIKVITGGGGSSCVQLPPRQHRRKGFSAAADATIQYSLQMAAICWRQTKRDSDHCWQWAISAAVEAASITECSHRSITTLIAPAPSEEDPGS